MNLEDKDIREGFLDNDALKDTEDILTRQQINQCLMDIEDIHPMRKCKMYEIFPFLKPCMKKKKVEFEDGLRIAMMNEIGLKIPKSELELQKMPFLRFGFGVNSYFDTLLQLFYLMSVISIVCIPMMYCYY
jgi:hypothetical protein